MDVCLVVFGHGSRGGVGSFMKKPPQEGLARKGPKIRTERYQPGVTESRDELPKCAMQSCRSCSFQTLGRARLPFLTFETSESALCCFFA